MFLRVHQALAILFGYSVWRHLPLERIFPRFYLHFSAALFASTFMVQTGVIIFRIFRYGFCRARISTSGGAVRVGIFPGKSVQVGPGQYIHVWIPRVSLFSSIQSHPFVVTSWAEGQQSILELFIKPRKGFTQQLMACANANERLPRSYLAFFSGPHGSLISAIQY